MTTSASQLEAFVLLNLPGATLRTPTTTQSGTLDLECVTVARHGSAAPSDRDRDVYLVLRLNAFETPIDPARVIHLSFSVSGQRTYTFDGTQDDPSDLVLTFPPTGVDTVFQEDLETFEGILAQYADLRRPNPTTHVSPAVSGAPVVLGASSTGDYGDYGDLRGHLVLINDDNGEVVGELDQNLSIREDPRLHERGHENDPVIIEVTEGEDLRALEMFARAVPPEEQDWMTKSATVISHTISATTNLLLTTITSASSYYMAHSTPSKHNPAVSTPNTTNPPPLPPRALVLLTSETTRKGLATMHTVSGHAVQVSSKTVSLIDRMIQRAVGGNGKSKRFDRTNKLSPTNQYPRSPSPSSIPLPPRSRSPSPSPDKPRLPPRRVPSPSPSSSSAIPPPPPFSSPAVQPPPVPARQLKTKHRILLTADLILATLEESAKQILDVGGNSLSAVVGHKYGPAAAQSSLLTTNTMQNVVLVYIDMRGIGRKALLRSAGKQFVKARLSSKK